MSDISDRITELKDDFTDLQAQMDTDKDLLALEPFSLKDTSDSSKLFPNAVNITRNQPQVAGDHALSKVLSVIPQWEVKGEKLNDKDTTRIEEFITNWLLTCDQLLGNREYPGIMFWAAQQVLFRGRVAFGPLILPERKFKVNPWAKRMAVPDIRLYDARYLCYSVDTEGIDAAVYTQKRSKAQILEEYDITIEGKSENVDVFWNRDENVIKIGEKEIPQKNPYEEVPIVCKVVPRGLFFDDEDRIKNSGRSVIAPNRSTYENNNRMASILATLTNKVLHQAMKHIGPPGEDNVSSLPGGLDAPGATIDLEFGEDLLPIEFQDINRSTMALLQMMEADEQKGMFASTSYGKDPGDHSAIALKELAAGDNSILVPYIECLQSAFIELIYMVIRQITKQKISLAVGPYGLEQEYRWHEFKGAYSINVELVPVDPVQDIANIQIASEMKNIGILSDDSIRRDVMSVRNPDEERHKKDVEDMRATDPVMDAYFRAHDLVDEYERTREDRYGEAAKRAILQFQELIANEAQARQPQITQPVQQGTPGRPNMMAALGQGGRVPRPVPRGDYGQNANA